MTQNKLKAVLLLFATAFLFMLVVAVYGEDRSIAKSDVTELNLLLTQRSLVEAQFKLLQIDYLKQTEKLQADYVRLTEEANAKRDKIFKDYGLDPATDDIELATGKVIPAKE